MASPTEDTKLQILNDHYKDTFNIIQDFRKIREQLLILILVATILLLFQIFSPAEASNAINQFLENQLKLKGPIDISFLGSVIWFGLLAFVVRYFQTNIHIERQYNYIHTLEKLLSQIYDGKAFLREGKAYLKEYPRFSSWASILYATIFPILLMLVVIAKISNEIYLATYVSTLLVFNILTALFILFSIVLYMLHMHFQK